MSETIYHRDGIPYGQQVMANGNGLFGGACMRHAVWLAAITLALVIAQSNSANADLFDWTRAEQILQGNLQPLPSMEQLTYKSGFSNAAHRGYVRALKLSWVVESGERFEQIIINDIGDTPLYVHAMNFHLVVLEYHFIDHERSSKVAKGTVAPWDELHMRIFKFNLDDNEFVLERTFSVRLPD